MSLGHPEVITGARGPRDENRERPRSSSGLPTVPDGKVTFQAIAGRYRLQLTAPDDLRLSDGRMIRGERPKVAQFDNYMVTYDAEKDAAVIEMIRQHPDYGREFWDLKDTIERAKQKQTESVLKVLEDPEQFRIISEAIEALKASQAADFKLPKKDPVE